MKSILLKAFSVSTLGVVLAYAMIIIFIPLFGEVINPSAWVLGAIGPYIIGMPVSVFCFWQADRLKDAHQKLLEAHSELSEKSRRDHMTGMLNRETFLSQLENLRRKSDHGVLLIADAIKASIRECDIAARIGGEEFAIFVSGADPEQSKIVSERMRRTVEAIEFRTSCGALVPLTISTGGAPSKDSQNLSELMRAADRCLYEAKRNGRNRVIFNSEFQ